MFRRFILALLIACLAFPAAAMPMLHARMEQRPVAMPMMAMADCALAVHHAAVPASHHEDGIAGQKHECIGCMARYDGVALPEARVLSVELPRCVTTPAQVAGAGAGPETPPPRC